jgi:hypothetical protein
MNENTFETVLEKRLETEINEDEAIRAALADMTGGGSDYWQDGVSNYQIRLIKEQFSNLLRVRV